jgi:hypothetical protein
MRMARNLLAARALPATALHRFRRPSDAGLHLLRVHHRCQRDLRAQAHEERLGRRWMSLESFISKKISAVLIPSSAVK